MKTQLLITDLDNTLYDWVGFFVPAFYAMVDVAVAITGCEREKLLDDLRTVHRTHHDAEHPFALLETNTIRQHLKGMSLEEMRHHLDEAFHAFNSVRKKHLSLYPGVLETIDTIKQNNIQLVAHTESKLSGVVDRLSRLNISQYFDAVYCIERPGDWIQNRTASNWDKLSSFPLDKVVELTHHQRKPNPEVLLEICRNREVSPAASIYVGDSLTRDMLLAKRANVFSAWARYGTQHDPEDYSKLIRISHWTDADIQREQSLRAEANAIQPDAVLEHGFDEIIRLLSAA